MSEAVTLRLRATSAPRCAVCHDVARPLKQCPRCASLFHEECRLGLKRCPTLGCEATARDPEETQRYVPPPRARLSPVTALAASTVTSIGIVADFALAGAIGHTVGGVLVVVGVLGALFHLFALPLLLTGSGDPRRRTRAAGYTLGAMFLVGMAFTAVIATLGALDAYVPMILVGALAWLFAPGLSAWLGDRTTGP